MNYNNCTDIPWNKINDFLIECGRIRDPKDFSAHIMKSISALIPYDQSRLYYLNVNGNVSDEILSGVNESCTAAYHEYYSKVENGRYSLLGKAIKNGHYIAPKVKDSVRDWDDCASDEFITEYLKPQGIRYSFGFMLSDMQYTPRCMFILDRVSKTKFSVQELKTMEIVLSHLNNLYQNYFVDSCLAKTGVVTKSELPLTTRELEITELLKKGISPTNISSRLWIEQATVYKHIYHIYAKLNVSSKQELLVKLLSDQRKQ